MNGLLQYPIAESTGRSTENIDSIIASNQVDVLNEQYKLHGAIGPDPNYDEEGNLRIDEGWAPDIALSPFVTPKGLLGLLKEARKTGDVTKLYRGVQDWRRGKMVKKGKFYLDKAPQSTGIKYHQGLGKGSQVMPGGDSPLPENVLWTTKNPRVAHGYATGYGQGRRVISKTPDMNSRVLEYEVPNQYLKHIDNWAFETDNAGEAAMAFYQGIPKQFLTNVRKTSPATFKSMWRNLGRINKDYKLGKHGGSTYGSSEANIKRDRTFRRRMRRWKKGVEKGTKGWRDMPWTSGPENPRVGKLIEKLYPDEYFSPDYSNMQPQEVYSALKIGSKKGRDELIREARRLMKEFKNR